VLLARPGSGLVQAERLLKPVSGLIPGIVIKTSAEPAK
jgi:hypothetical protein